MKLEETGRIGTDDSKPTGPKDGALRKAVASALSDYQTKRNAWLAEVEHLNRLCDEVRSAAERESLEIMAKARREARQVIETARRELIVLSEQVRAALGDSGPMEAIELLPDSARRIVMNETPPPALSTSVVSDTHPRRETTTRDDPWADLDSLVNEAKSSKV